MPTLEERLAQLEAQVGLQQQQLTLAVEVMRLVLQGKFDDGRICLDSIDPARAGQWTNVEFPVPGRAAGAPGGAVAAPTAPPRVVWVGSPNFWPGRPNGQPIAIVIHTMGGTLAGTDSWFQTRASEVSAHYGIGLDGTVHQYVKLEDRAWTNGVLEPNNTWFGRSGVNPNDQTVSIETEDLGMASQAVTDAQWNATLAVCQQVLEAYPSIKYLTSHHVISPQSRAGCCGPRWTGSGRFAALAEALGLQPRA